MIHILLICNFAYFYLENNNFLYFLEKQQEILTSKNRSIDHNYIILKDSQNLFLFFFLQRCYCFSYLQRIDLKNKIPGWDRDIKHKFSIYT